MADQENVLKKSYTGLLLWLAAFAVVLYVVTYVAKGTDFRALLGFNITGIAFFLLSFITYKTQQIYWYNGVFYEDAVAATEEQKMFL